MDDKLIKAVPIDELNAVPEPGSKSESLGLLSSDSCSELAVCDEIQWNELLELDESDEFVSGILHAFIEQAGQLASRLPGLVDDPAVLASEAHKLKGAAGYIGAARAAYFCGLVESVANSSPSRLDQKTVADLKNALSVSVEDYRKRLKKS